MLESFREDQELSRPGCLWPRWLFLRLLGIGFLTGFLSLAAQIQGLIGPRGILPASQLLQAVAEKHPGPSRFLLVPSLLWWDSGPLGLDVLCWGGTIAGAMLVLNLWPRLAVFVCWLFTLSFVTAARQFSGFQSDGLMLETGLLAVFLAPCGLRPGLGAHDPPSRFSVFMVRWLLFRLMLGAGLAKLFSGDPDWQGFTAMDDYYENCPFPTWIGWWIQHLPHVFHAGTVAYTLAVEVLCPFLIWFGRGPRLVLFPLWTALQLGILLGGNYTFLNYNAIGLGLLLLDDQALGRVLRLQVPAAPPRKPQPVWRRAPEILGLGFLLYLSSLIFLRGMGLQPRALPEVLTAPAEAVSAFRVANRYALFAVMTHGRREIEIEGSSDGGQTWKTYRFRWQPQDPGEAPRFMAPHLPRFDWNLWFAALGSYEDWPLVLHTGLRLMENEPTVTALFAENPFPDAPPTRIRFPLYSASFTDVDTWRRTGLYWRRERIGEYAPMLVLDAGSGKVRLEEPPGGVVR
jgi:lipase maturation factor